MLMKTLCLPTWRRCARTARGMTLAEMLISVGIGSMILLVMGVVFVSSLFSFAELGNYISMDQTSRNALDRMTMYIRRAKDLTSYDPALLVFNYDGAGTMLTYRYDGSSGVLTEEWSTKTNTLLTRLSSLQFTMFDRNLAPTTDVSVGKLISVAWKCSTNVVGRPLTSEEMQQAQIVIRNKP